MFESCFQVISCIGDAHGKLQVSVLQSLLDFNFRQTPDLFLVHSMGCNVSIPKKQNLILLAENLYWWLTGRLRIAPAGIAIIMMMCHQIGSLTWSCWSGWQPDTKQWRLHTVSRAGVLLQLSSSKLAILSVRVVAQWRCRWHGHANVPLAIQVTFQVNSNLNCGLSPGPAAAGSIGPVVPKELKMGTTVPSRNWFPKCVPRSTQSIE